MYCWWEYKKVTATVKNIMVAPQKIQHSITIWSILPGLGISGERTKSRVLKRYLYAHVQNSITHNSLNGEATQVSSTDEMVSKMVYIHTMEYQSALKSYSMAEP